MMVLMVMNWANNIFMVVMTVICTAMLFGILVSILMEMWCAVLPTVMVMSGFSVISLVMNWAVAVFMVMVMVVGMMVVVMLTRRQPGLMVMSRRP